MQRVCHAVHVVAMGLWAGTAVFFNGIVALRVFEYFRALAEHPVPGLDNVTPTLTSRLAGDLMSNIFPCYFATQCVMGVIASVTAVRLARCTNRRQWIRAGLIVVTTAMVMVHVATLYRTSKAIRVEQYAALDAGRLDEAEALRKRFFAYHGPSLLLDWGTTVLVLVGLASMPAPASACPVSDRAVKPVGV